MNRPDFCPEFSKNSMNDDAFSDSRGGLDLEAPGGSAPPACGEIWRRDLAIAIAENSTLALVMMDERGYCTYANRAFLDMTGFSPEEIRSRPLHYVIHHHYPDGRPYPMEECPIDRALPEDFTVRSHEDLFFRKDGSSFPVECAASPIFENGRAVSTIIEIRDVTAEKEADRALRESELRFRRMADAAPAMLWVTGPDNDTTFLSRAFYEFTGLTADECLGLAWLNAIHPDNREEVMRRFVEASEKRDSFSLDFRLRRHDGNFRWVYYSGRPQYDINGEWEGITGFVTDVHERRVSQEALRLSEERYRLINRATNDVIWDWNIATDQLEWSHALREHLGYTPEEFGNTITDWYDKLHPEDRQRIRSGIETAITGAGDVWTDEYRLLRRDGTYASLLDRGYIARDASGNVYRMTGSLVNLTDQKATEEVLSEAVRRFEMLADMIPQFVWSTLPDGYHDYFNDRWYEYTGMPRDSDEGWRWKDYLHPDDIDKTFDAWSRSLESGLPYETKYRFKRASDGTYRWFIGRAIPIYDSDGQVSRWFGTSTDIEDQQREEEKLEIMVAQRTEMLIDRTDRLRALASELTSAEQRERKRLAAVLHDDLQQMLYAAQMKLRLTTRNQDLDAIRKLIDDALEQIVQAVDSARTMTCQLRPPALYEAGLVPALEWLAADIMDRHSMEVSITGPGMADTIGDDMRALLFESVRELLFNIVKYAKTDRANVDVEQDGSSVRIVVSDDGEGFDPATRIDNRKQGFGLFSVHERIAAIGGEFTIDSAVKRGTRVEITAPLVTRTSKTTFAGAFGGVAGRGRNTRAEDGQDASRGVISVVVVDDHAMVREGLCTLIDSDPRMRIVGQASDGAEALIVLETTRPDVVLIDLNMPKMNGIEATREIVSRWPGVSVIGMSMHGDEVTARSMTEAGACAFLAKAGDADEMLDTIIGARSRLPAG
jgi:PAS domain S-box-containing protein